MKISRITKDSPAYPQRLSHIPDAPAQLFVSQDITDLLGKPTLAIVGSRKVTPYGRQVTDMLARVAARLGITIISGLALGIDAVAHQAALAEQGATIAVLPCGLDTIYPSSHYVTPRGTVLRAIETIGRDYPEFDRVFVVACRQGSGRAADRSRRCAAREPRRQGDARP